MRRAVLNLTDARPAWRIPEESLEAITSAFPSNWDVVVVTSAVDGRGDGGSVSTEALAAVTGAEVCIGYGMPHELFVAATVDDDSALRWVHTATAGVGSLLYPEMVTSPIVLTNSAGIHAPPIAETVMAMVLHFARALDVAVEARARRAWGSERIEQDVGLAREIVGATLGIVGLGGIGREIAWRAHALGMHVIGVRRSHAETPENVEMVTGDGALLTLLARSDFIVICVPSTPETRGMIDARELAAIRSGAVLINVSRGDIIADEQALARALAEGRLRGAGLDVFHVEPLPASSPLWDPPNVLITPHVSGATDRFWERETALIVENVRRYLGGEPLKNVVDKRRGY